MKKSIKTIGALAIMFLTILACKKEESVKLGEEKFSVAIQVASAKGKTEHAIIIGTKAELETALKERDGAVYLKKVAKSNNVFIPVLDTDYEPVDPHKLCWEEINAYYNENVEAWQQLANQTCTNVLRCITCPNAGVGLFVMYDIKPNSLRCNMAEAVAVQYAFSKFDFGDDDLESEALAAYIRKK